MVKNSFGASACDTRGVNPCDGQSSHLELRYLLKRARFSDWCDCRPWVFGFVADELATNCAQSCSA